MHNYDYLSMHKFYYLRADIYLIHRQIKKITGSFTGGSITSDRGLLLLREVDKRLQLTNKIAKLIIDKRD